MLLFAALAIFPFGCGIQGSPSPGDCRIPQNVYPLLLSRGDLDVDSFVLKHKVLKGWTEVVPYVDGVTHGISFTRGPHGELAGIGTYWDGHLFGSQYLFKEDTTSIRFRTLSRCDVCELVQTKDALASSGVCHHVVYKNSIVKAGEGFSVMVFGPNIPGFTFRCEGNLLSGSRTPNGPQVGVMGSAIEHFYAIRYQLDTALRDTGLYEIQGITTLQCDSGDWEKVDTFSVELRVR